MDSLADTLSRQEAASLLRWWIDAGVDVAVAEQPFRWLRSPEQPQAPATGKPAQPSRELPSTLEAFRSWLEAAPDLPFAAPGRQRVLPVGPVNPSVMVVCDAPGHDDASTGRPIGGLAWQLAQRMMSAIGIASDQVYSSSLCAFATSARLGGPDLERSVAIFRHHLGLARPKRLLLLGDGPSRALLGEPLASARGKLHSYEGVPVVVTFHPRFLIQRPGDKGLAWQDLLLFPQEVVE